MFPASSLGPVFTPAGYDAVLYTLGATRDEVYRLACTYPGVVWLHDLALADGELMGRARGVILASPTALSIVQSMAGRWSETTPMWIVPFAVSESSDMRRERMQAPSFDQVAQAVLRIAQVDLDTSRPSDETALVTHPDA